MVLHNNIYFHTDFDLKIHFDTSLHTTLYYILSFVRVHPPLLCILSFWFLVFSRMCMCVCVLHMQEVKWYSQKCVKTYTLSTSSKETEHEYLCAHVFVCVIVPRVCAIKFTREYVIMLLLTICAIAKVKISKRSHPQKIGVTAHCISEGANLLQHLYRTKGCVLPLRDKDDKAAPLDTNIQKIEEWFKKELSLI